MSCLDLSGSWLPARHARKAHAYCGPRALTRQQPERFFQAADRPFSSFMSLVPARRTLSTESRGQELAFLCFGI